jgi:hypothetical protein
MLPNASGLRPRRQDEAHGIGTRPPPRPHVRSRPVPRSRSLSLRASRRVSSRGGAGAKSEGRGTGARACFPAGCSRRSPDCCAARGRGPSPRHELVPDQHTSHLVAVRGRVFAGQKTRGPWLPGARSLLLYAFACRRHGSACVVRHVGAPAMRPRRWGQGACLFILVVTGMWVGAADKDVNGVGGSYVSSICWERFESHSPPRRITRRPATHAQPCDAQLTSTQMHAAKLHAVWL